MALTGSLRTPDLSQFKRDLLARVQGPGGYYNLGNVIGIVGGIALQIVHGGNDPAQSVTTYLAGSASAFWMTIATLIFMVSGEAYHRAWKFGFPPNKSLNWWGDFLSGFGALALGISLFLLGQPLLAATAGLLHAYGKFGSAFGKQHDDATFDWPNVFRWMVVFSRMPAIGAALITLIHASVPGGGTALAAPIILICCTALWLRADLMLLKG